MRIITDYDLAASAQLKKVYNNKKRDLHLTQHKLADALGVSQGYVAQCMNGHVSMDLRAILQFSQQLHVPPTEIDPNFNKRFPQASAVMNPARLLESLPHCGTFEDHSLSIEHDLPVEQRFKEEYCVIRAEADIHPYIPKGSQLLIATRMRGYRQNAPILIEHKEQSKWHYVVDTTKLEDGKVTASTTPHQRGMRYYPVVLVQYL